MSDMIEVVIDSIRVSLMSQQRIVVLREKNADRYLAIWIGIYEAESITIALQEVEVARPLTHDLLKNLLKELGARVLRVEVVSLQDDTFYGNIAIEADGRILNIDARPSDALAIAVRANVPVYVHSSVMDAAGIIPEEDLQGEAPPARAKSAKAKAVEPEDTEGDERLSVFQDFLEGLDLGDTDSEEENKED